jgi:hypothetical protein
MRLVRFFTLAVLLGLALTACGASPSAGGDVTQPATPTARPTQAPQPALAQDLARSDDQGAVTLVVTPLNLNNPGQTLDFDVAMETHSVDLSMDLAAVSTLTTDTGRSVQATRWDAPRGGHHVEGKLSFPANVDGVPVLEGATKLTLIVRDVDAPERAFVWQLSAQ